MPSMLFFIILIILLLLDIFYQQSGVIWTTDLQQVPQLKLNCFPSTCRLSKSEVATTLLLFDFKFVSMNQKQNIFSGIHQKERVMHDG